MLEGELEQYDDVDDDAVLVVLVVPVLSVLASSAAAAAATARRERFRYVLDCTSGMTAAERDEDNWPEDSSSTRRGGRGAYLARPWALGGGVA